MPAHRVDLDNPIDDPLSRVLAPPRHEKPAERQARLEAERLAKKRSDLIDEDIDRERQAERRGMKPVKILLLGAYSSQRRLP
jgi:guanine nucleotide-binding protein alpha-1 subunit